MSRKIETSCSRLIQPIHCDMQSTADGVNVLNCKEYLLACVLYCPIAHRGELVMQKCTVLAVSNLFNPSLGIPNSIVFFIRTFTFSTEYLHMKVDMQILP